MVKILDGNRSPNVPLASLFRLRPRAAQKQHIAGRC